MGIHHKAGRNSAKTDRIFKLFQKYLKKTHMNPSRKSQKQEVKLRERIKQFASNF